MKAEELMIGDWVQIVEPCKYAGAIGRIKTLIDHKDNENAYFKVFLRNNTICIGIEDICSEDIRPIPLTTEILENIGFYGGEYKHYCGDVWHLELEGFIEIGFTYSNGKGVLWGAKIKSNYPITIVDKFVIPNITCLHELQHAMKLCRIDKKFEL